MHPLSPEDLETFPSGQLTHFLLLIKVISLVLLPLSSYPCEYEPGEQGVHVRLVPLPPFPCPVGHASQPVLSLLTFLPAGHPLQSFEDDEPAGLLGTSELQGEQVVFPVPSAYSPPPH